MSRYWPPPRWALIAGGAAVLLLAPLGFLLLVPPTDPDSPEIPPISSEDESRVEQALQVIEQGNFEEMRSLIGSTLTADYPPSAYPQFLEAFRARHEPDITRDGVLTYVRLLVAAVNRQIPVDNLSYHLGQLRRQCLDLGGLPFLAEVADELFENRDLAAYYPGVRPEIIAHEILFERWDRALATYQLQRTESTGFGDAGRRLLARRLARIFGQSGSVEARAAFDTFLAEVSTELQEPKSAGEAARSWLRGVVRYNTPDSSFDRGQALLEAGLVENPADPGFGLTHLDFAAALAEEASRREASLRLEFARAGGSPARQIFRIGWRAAALGDREELDFALRRLREDAGVVDAETALYQQLLWGLQELLGGFFDTGRARIAGALARTEEPARILARDFRQWQSIAQGGEIPLLETGPALFKNGKSWWELRQWDRLRRTADQLQKSLSSPRDLACLNFLRAVLGYRDNEVRVARELLMKILDEGPPPGLTRGEVSSLLVLSEEREQELLRITALRRQARDHLERVLVSAPESSLETELASVEEWRLDLQELGVEFLSQGGRERLDRILAARQGAAMEFELLEGHLALQELAFSITREHFQNGEFDSALLCLQQCRELMGNPARYERMQAQILQARAERDSSLYTEKSQETWLAAGDAYLAAADPDFGDQSFLLDAAQCYAEAGSLEPARRAARKFSPHDRSTARGETQYWQRFVTLARVERRLGNYSDALRVVEEAVDQEDAGRFRYQLLLERGLAREALGSPDDLVAALADFDLVYSGLLPSNTSWQTAVFHKAQILHRQLLSLAEDAPEAAALRDQSLRVWEDLASRLSVEKGSADLAEALFRAAEGRALGRQHDAARQHFERLEQAAIYVLEEPGLSISPAERERWSRFGEKGAFGMADNHYEAGSFPLARARYERAVRRFADSPLVVWGHYRLGDLAVKRGEPNEARAAFELARAMLGRLDDRQLQELPPHYDREFWIQTLQERSRALGRI